MNFTKLYPLNAKAIKKTLGCYEIKPISLRQGRGSLKGSISLMVRVEDAQEVASICANLGMVNTLGKNPIVRPTSQNYYDFGSLYMSEEMYKEINE